MIPRSEISKEETTSTDHEHPADNKVVEMMWWAAFLIGLSLSLPLSATLIAAKFFDLRFNSPTLSYAFPSFFAATFLGTKLVAAVINRAVAARRGGERKGGWMLPVEWSVSGLAGVVFLMILCLVQTFANGELLFAMILTLSVLMAGLTSLPETGALAALSRLPPQVTQAVFMGQGLAAIWTSGISLLFQVFLPPRFANYIAVVNYVISLLVVVACAYKWHRSTVVGAVRSDDVEAPPKMTTSTAPSTSSVIAVASKIPFQIATVSLSNILSMTIFPFMVNKTQPTTIPANLFYPLAFFVSSLADMLGRVIPGWIPHARQHFRTIFAISWSRLLVLALFLAGNLQIDGKALRFNFYQSDLAFFFGLVVSGVVHGGATTMSAMQVPFMVDAHEQGTAASLLGLIGMGGAFTGCLLSLTLAFGMKKFGVV
jgi:hypothetical protein